MSYSEKLKDQRWQRKRLEMLEKAGWKCQYKYCQTTTPNPTLSVHHRVYLRKTEPWDYPDWAYQVVCDECHMDVQSEMEDSHCLLAKNQELQHALLWLSKFPERAQIRISETLLCALAWKNQTVSENLFESLRASIEVAYSAMRYDEEEPATPTEETVKAA